MATAGSSNERGGESVLSEELYDTAILMQESIRCVQAWEKKMIDAGPSDSTDHKNLLELKSGMLEVSEKIFGLADSETQTRIRAIQNDELLRNQILTHLRIGQEEETNDPLDLAAIETQLDRIVGESDDNSPSVSWEETIRRRVADIMSKYEAEVGDIASVLEAEETRKEAEAVLSFGFRLGLFGRQIDELRRELRRLVRSFSPENKDVMRTMIMFTREPYLRRIAKLRWISERLGTIQRMDPDLDSKVKSAMIEMKSEYFLSAISAIKEEERSDGEGAAGEEGDTFSIEMDEKRFAAYRLCWERTWGNGYSFEDRTLLSPMQFTHCTPRRIPADAVAGSSLQIYSIKVSPKELNWPLNVYGVVTARDAADRQRNPLFLRTRNYCQILTEKDPFLQLTGPVHAIVSMDTVYIETELKLKGAAKSEDRTLVSTFNLYNGDNFPTCLADNHFCRVELCFEKFEQSVQATIMSVIVEAKQGSLPFPYGGKVFCTLLPGNGNEDTAGLSSRQVLLLDSIDGRMVMARNGHLDLLRRVVSVELTGKLKFQIQTYLPSQSADITAHVIFTPKKWNISKDACYLDDGSKVEITVAWSLLPPSKMLS